MSSRGSPVSYRSAEVQTSSPGQLVVMLYRHLALQLRKAADQIRRRDIEGKAESVQRASAILYELLGSLDMDADEELPTRLASLYGFFLQEIDAASRELDADRVEGVLEMVEDLQDAWDEAARTVQQDGAGRRPRGLA
jgi:flagellar protein FliS